MLPLAPARGLQSQGCGAGGTVAACTRNGKAGPGQQIENEEGIAAAAERLLVIAPERALVGDSFDKIGVMFQRAGVDPGGRRFGCAERGQGVRIAGLDAADGTARAEVGVGKEIETARLKPGVKGRERRGAGAGPDNQQGTNGHFLASIRFRARAAAWRISGLGSSSAFCNAGRAEAAADPYSPST